MSVQTQNIVSQLVCGEEEEKVDECECPENKTKTEAWMAKYSIHIPTVINPDDGLMQRFQNALRAHLERIDNRLSDDIYDLEAEIKQAEKEHEDGCLQLYNAQQEIAKQRESIEKYQSMLSNIVCLREEKEKHVDQAKEERKKAYECLTQEQAKEEKLVHEFEKMNSLKRQFEEWEKELSSFLTISKKISVKDKTMQKDLINQKQQKDCLLLKLQDEIWNLETEIAHLSEQIELKQKEKSVTSQLVADANADLEALHQQHKKLCNAWNFVVLNISKRDKVYDDLNADREKVRESFYNVQAEIDKMRKDTIREIETNENLTATHARITENIRVTGRMLNVDAERASTLEHQLFKAIESNEETQKKYDVAYADYQQIATKEDAVEKELARLTNIKNELETKVYQKLEEKVTHDKAARYLNKMLLNKRETLQEQELAIVQAENNYGRNLYEIERLNVVNVIGKEELQDIASRNAEKEKEIGETQKEVARCETAIERNHRRIAKLNKEIDQALANTGGEEISPQELKIMTLERNIQEIEEANQSSQQFWLRQQSFMVTLSEQRDEQLQELNLLSKETVIMEQKNLKLEYTLEKFEKEEANMERTMNLLRQRLSHVNASLVMQKELKEELQDKNCIAKNEYVRSLEDAEMELIKLQSEVKRLHCDRESLKEELVALQRDSLSWEKKVQLVQETARKLRDERSSVGDIGTMKSEIHKMEMRLSHLRRAQEKLIHDMEYCIARRDVIVDKVMGKLKKNPKEEHNQKIVLRKRLDDQKMKIKMLTKETNQIQMRTNDMEEKCKAMSTKIDELKERIEKIRRNIPEIEKEIEHAEFIKYHNLKVLVFKQRKVKLLQDVKNGRYKPICKNEIALDEELQNERNVHSYLIDVMERTKQDFPHLESSVRRIFLTLEM